MKKETAIPVMLTVAIVAFSVVSASAQTAVNIDANASVNSGGGLGKGLNSMVRNILGDGDNQAPVAPQAGLMMESNAALDMAAPTAASMAAPAPQTRMMKAETSNTMMAYAQTALPATEDDVSQLVHSLLEQDDHLQSIDASDTHVRMTYRTEGTVFRFIRVTVPVTAEAYISGKTVLSYPWYARLSNTSDLRARFDARIASIIQKDSITPDNRIALINEMYAFFQAELQE